MALRCKSHCALWMVEAVGDFFWELSSAWPALASRSRTRPRQPGSRLCSDSMQLRWCLRKGERWNVAGISVKHKKLRVIKCFRRRLFGIILFFFLPRYLKTGIWLFCTYYYSWYQYYSSYHYFWIKCLGIFNFKSSNIFNTWFYLIHGHLLKNFDSQYSEWKSSTGINSLNMKSEFENLQVLKKHSSHI